MSDKDYIFFEPSQKLHKKSGKVYWRGGERSDYYYVRRGAPVITRANCSGEIECRPCSHPVHNEPFEDLGYKPNFKIFEEGDMWRLEDSNFYGSTWWIRKEDLFNV